jgi:DNA-binding XRE family transcriptional regulator
MKSEIGALIAECREKSGLTQDQFGQKYSVSGPAIFKFEKGYVKPSLDLWLQFAKDLSITEQQAVLLWIKAKLPKKYQSFVSLEAPVVREDAKGYGRKSKLDGITDAAKAREIVLSERTMPKGLKRLLKDDDLWELYKPLASEINTLAVIFGKLGDGTKSSYREALRLVREFAAE